MLNYLWVAALALLVSTPAVAQTKVIVCWVEPTLHVNNNPFSQDNELRVRKGGIDLLQRDQLDMTRIALPPELRARPVGDAKQINLLVPLKRESRNCQVADREPNGALQFH
jgi:hypothetical protein